MYMCCMLTLSNRSIQEEEDEEEAPEFIAEDEIEESDLSDIEVHTHPSIVQCNLVPRHPDFSTIKDQGAFHGERLSAVIY